MLIKEFFRACSGARRIVLWVAAANFESIAKYRHFGFNPEALEDRVMSRNHGARNH
jgi:RimJ/RimL family protein N-acetyltransferase